MATQEDIRKAAEQLTARGEKATVRAVQGMIGGDRTLITKALADMRAAATLEGVTVPDAILTALTGALRQERKAGAASRDQEIEEAQADLADALKATDTAAVRMKTLEEEKAALQTEGGKLTALLERAKADTAAAQDAARIAEKRAQDADARIIRAEAAADQAARTAAEALAAAKAQAQAYREEAQREREAARIAAERAAVAEAATTAAREETAATIAALSATQEKKKGHQKAEVESVA